VADGGQRVSGIADQDDLGGRRVGVDDVEDSVEPARSLLSRRVLRILAVDEAADQHAVIVGGGQCEAIGGLPTIARWITVARQYEIVVQSLLSIRYSAGLYTQNRFHNVISAAESFHRLRFSNEIMPEDEFKTFRRWLIRAVPKEHRGWLSNQLQYSNEPRLRNRLSEMIEYVGSAFATLCDDPRSWVTVVTESRNRLTHYDKVRQIEFATGDLYFLTQSVFMLVMLCLFRECEVAAETLDAIGETAGINFLKSKLGEIVPRLCAQIEEIKERERAERKKSDDAADNQRTPTDRSADAPAVEPNPAE
jgi:ApeA N-terminal domain 1